MSGFYVGTTPTPFTAPSLRSDLKSFASTDDTQTFPPYTVLTHCSCGVQELINIKSVYKNTDLKELIPLKPERLMIQSICVNTITKFQIYSPNKNFDESISELVLRINELFLERNPRYVDRISTHFDKLNSEAIKVLSAPNHKCSLNDEYAIQVKKTYNNIPDLKEEITEEIKIKAASLRISDLTIRKVIDEKVKKFVSTLKNELCSYKDLTFYDKNKNRIFMVNGGIASGKGTAVRQIAEKLKETSGIEWSDVLTLNTDSFKSLFYGDLQLATNPPSVFYYSQLTHDEASLIRNRIFNRYVNMLKKGAVPHLFVDQVWPAEDVFTIGADSINGIDSTIVQIPVEKSLDMAFKRGELTQRFEPTRNILMTHKGVPSQLNKTLSSISKSEKRNVRIELLENVDIGKVSEIAYIDLNLILPRIVNLNSLYEFYKKTTLNIDASSEAELYDVSGAAVSRQMVLDLISFCKNRYFKTQNPSYLASRSFS